MNLLLDLFENCERAPELDDAISCMAEHDESGRGAVFTRPEVVCSILDLSGYTTDRPLHQMRLLEPAFGAGDFLFQAIDRLWTAYVGSGGTAQRAGEDLSNAIRAVELHRATFETASQHLLERLARYGVSAKNARTLCNTWLTRDDFLLTQIDGAFDFVVGNPPYVRQERIPAVLLSEYRRRFETLFDRADLYIPFFERGLDLLGADGVLGFICSNRWLKNRYGGPLREKISAGYWLQYFIDMEQTNAFHSDVIAYPAITVLQRVAGTSGNARPTRASMASNAPLSVTVDALLANTADTDVVQEIDLGGSGSSPLLLDDIPRIALLRRIERDFPRLEQAGCQVGIGVATGCNQIYIDDMDMLPVEPARKVPLVMARDLVNGQIAWGGKAVLNPFDETGRLVDLEAFPAFARYVQTHRELIAGRNVAKRSPSGWYRTIDRIRPGLQQTPKILVPDIKGKGVFVIDEGHYYPHHNLYFITSSEWNLCALQTVLRSSLTLMTVATYCTRMAGGFLRFQAQYLRRIRLPKWETVHEVMRERLIAASTSCNLDEIDATVFELYGLDATQAAHTRDVAEAARMTKEGPR